MKFSIKVYLNRIPDNYKILDDFELARQYHLKHGVELQYVFVKSDITGYVSTFNALINRWLLEDIDISPDNSFDANMFVFDQGEWATPPGSQFPLKPQTPNGVCYIIGTKPFINVGSYIVDHENGQTWIQIAHELMHALRMSANECGFPVPDVMDSYRENSNPDSPTGNFAQQWSLLENFIDKSSNENFVFLHNLFFGMITNDVQELQKKLAVLALYNSTFDGDFGPKTLQAVKNYQRIKGLEVDGKVGPLTRASLNK